MTTKKWGETFLKTGLPLEHLTITTFSGLGWDCEPRYEYVRPNRKGDQVCFEIDFIASPPSDPAGNLNLLIECKYHDEQRFWFFLPCTTVDQLAQYGALSAGGDLESDAEVLHYAPYVPLRNKRRHSLISLAPKSIWGVTVSRAGRREENSIKEALDQLAFAFVPFCLDRLYSFCQYTPVAVIPVIVTTARLFRLRPDVREIATIRGAHRPEEIADELSGTWCYYAPRGELLEHNHTQIEHWRKTHKEINFRGLDGQLARLWSGPHWVMIVTVDALAEVASIIHKTFLALPKNFSSNKRLRDTIEACAAHRRARFRTNEEG